MFLQTTNITFFFQKINIIKNINKKLSNKLINKLVMKNKE